MRRYKIDRRDREDIIEQIKSMAVYYAPQWRFNPDDADPGTALALIWADMFADTLRKYNQILEQNKTAFFNVLGAELRPAIGAEGFLTFELRSGTEQGGYIERYTEVFANSDDDESIYFTTNSGIYVTPARITDIVSAMPGLDKLIHSWNGQAGISLFDKNGINLQTHYLYIGHNEVFDVSSEGCIFVRFTSSKAESIFTGLFIEETAVLWEYLSYDGFVPFAKVSAIDSGIALQFDGSPICEGDVFQLDSPIRLIRLTLLQPEKFTHLSFEQINVYSQNYNIAPSVIYSDDLQQSEYGFYPFGEKFTIYKDLYIACDEALGKPGAEIELSFDLRYFEIEIEDRPEKEVNWKLIMRKRDLEREPEYKILLKKTSWEYFNGMGWASLPITSADYESLFYTKKGDENAVRCRINFTCPEDIGNILVNAYDKKYIRIRVLEIENAYRISGHYVTPWMENISFRYHYENKNVLPTLYAAKSNGELEIYNESIFRKDAVLSFFDLKYTSTAVYFRFDSMPSGAPVKFLFSMENENESRMPLMVWEYYTKSGWNTLTVYDETVNFMKSGIITFIGQKDFEPVRLFGMDGFWIRCIDINSEYEKPEQSLFPVVKDIYPNTVRISNKRQREQELFSVEINNSNNKFELANNRVSDIKCYVAETKLQHEEIMQMSEYGEAEIERDENGEVTKVWVLWEERSNFVFSGSTSRHYVIDRNTGVVAFGDGVHGKIPESIPEEDSVRILYSTNDGIKSNLDTGRIERFSSSNDFISRIYNPLPTVGGYNHEDTKGAVVRSGKALTHMFRAVSVSDYEALAYEASQNVKKCKCFPNTNGQEEYEEGCVTLVVLQKDYAHGSDYFLELRKTIKSFILSRNALPLAAERKFEVARPRFVRMNVKVYCGSDSMDNVFYMQQEVINRINKFLNPVSGNFDGMGWEIGSIPNTTQIANYIKSVDHIRGIEQVIITYGTLLEHGFSEVDLDHIGRYRFILPENGEHEVYVNSK